MGRSSGRGSRRAPARYEAASAADIARRGAGRRRAGGAPAAPVEPARPTAQGGPLSDAAPRPAGAVRLGQTDRRLAAERAGMRRKVAMWAVLLAVLAFVSCGIIGGAYTWEARYTVYSPLEVARVAWVCANNFLADAFQLTAPIQTLGVGEAREQLMYLVVPEKAGVVVITLVCAVLLSVSGALYQNVFKNPIAGPGMLGVSSGVQLGLVVLVYAWGADAMAMAGTRYALCYGLGALVLLLVVAAGRRLSGAGRPFDVVSMLLIGAIVGQLVGFVTQYLTLFVMDPATYAVYLTLSEMLVVDVSPVSWACLAIACAASLVPVWLLRFRLNALSFDEQEVRLLGVNMTLLRAVALVCGAVMILAAQIHIGAVALVSLVVPFLARAWFGCEFRQQLVGNLCISTILLLVCRDVVDLIPFVGDGIGIGSAVSVIALPIFLLIMARHLRGWE